MSASCFMLMIAVLLHSAAMWAGASVSCCVYGSAPVSCSIGAAMLRLRGGAEDSIESEAEGPIPFRDFDAPEDATNPEGFVRAAEARDENMDHAEFQRYAEKIKGGSTSTPGDEKLEEALKNLEKTEHERKSRGPQVLFAAAHVTGPAFLAYFRVC